MNFNWNKDHTTKALYASLVICSSILFALIMFNLNHFINKANEIIIVFQPFIIGGVIAYLLNFGLKFFESKIEQIYNKYNKSKTLNKKTKRFISITITYSIASLILYGCFYFVLPQLIDSVKGIINDIPSYIESTTALFNSITKELNLNPDAYSLLSEELNKIITYIAQVSASLIPVVGELVKTTASSIWNTVLGIIISIYFLIDKEKFKALFKKIMCALFSKKHSNKIIELTRRSNNIFGKFIIGKIIDSTIIGILTFIVVEITDMPYTVLISVIVGVTNIIPFFGPFIGAIPCIILIMFVSPIKSLWFALIIVIIQQLDGNIIGPKILGDSIGISAFWILFSLLIAGKLFGLIGMIIGVPVFAVIYSIIKDLVESRLRKKGLPTETNSYLD